MLRGPGRQPLLALLVQDPMADREDEERMLAQLLDGLDRSGTGGLKPECVLGFVDVIEGERELRLRRPEWFHPVICFDCRADISGRNTHTGPWDGGPDVRTICDGCLDARTQKDA
jgi:hypothetical protein